MGYELVLVEDKAAASFSMVPGLEREGHHITLVHTSKAATRQVTRQWPDAVILNLISGKFDPVKVCQKLDDTELQIPCLIVTDETMTVPPDAATVLKSPYSQSELAKQLDHVAAASTRRFWRLGGLILDTTLRQVLHAGKTFLLTPKEFDLLHLLASRPGEVVSRREIMNQVWQTDYLGDTRTLDVHVRWLRQKIERNPSRPARLLTARGIGYRFVVPGQA
ncbi:MAG: winged-helix domain-containing protein [Anaerolineae bacterium]